MDCRFLKVVDSTSFIASSDLDVYWNRHGSGSNIFGRELIGREIYNHHMMTLTVIASS